MSVRSHALVTSLCFQNLTHMGTTEGKMVVLGEGGRAMARLIQFYVPQSFKPPKRQWVTLDKCGKLIEFQRRVAATKSA